MAQTVGTEALRRLAFLAGGTGGRGTGAPTMWAPTWYGGGGRRTLAWTAQTCCGAVDFMAPWRVVRWQPDSLSFLPLPDGVVGDGEEAKDAAATLQALHELAGAVPEEAVPDGAVPAALPRFLRLVGMAEAEMAGALLGMEGGALRMVLGGSGSQAAGNTGDAPLAIGGDPPRVARDGALPHASRLSWVRR